MKIFDLNNLDLTPLEEIVQKHLNLTQPIKFEKKIKEKNENQYIDFQSTNIVVLTGIFKWILKECTIGSFSGGTVYEDDKGDEFIWMKLNIFYQHEGGGRNGMTLCECYYYVEDNKWEIKFVGCDYEYVKKGL